MKNPEFNGDFTSAQQYLERETMESYLRVTGWLTSARRSVTQETRWALSGASGTGIVFIEAQPGNRFQVRITR